MHRTIPCTAPSLLTPGCRGLCGALLIAEDHDALVRADLGGLVNGPANPVSVTRSQGPQVTELYYKDGTATRGKTPASFCHVQRLLQG